MQLELYREVMCSYLAVCLTISEAGNKHCCTNTAWRDNFQVRFCSFENNIPLQFCSKFLKHYLFLCDHNEKEGHKSQTSCVQAYVKASSPFTKTLNPCIFFYSKSLTKQDDIKMLTIGASGCSPSK